MQMLKVNSFLGCIELETGGLIIGWLNAIGDFIGVLLGTALLIFLSVYDCNDLNKLLMQKHEGVLDADELYICSFGRGIVILFVVFGTALATGFLIASYFFLKGLNRKNHVYLKPLMVLMASMAILTFLDIFSSNISSMATIIVTTILYAYEFIVIYSIYKKFEEQFYKAPPAYYQAPTEKV